jgi:hypothetical protein
MRFAFGVVQIPSQAIEESHRIAPRWGEPTHETACPSFASKVGDAVMLASEETWNFMNPQQVSTGMVNQGLCEGIRKE